MAENRDILSYRTYYCICRDCNKMMTIAFRGKLPIWEETTCPVCLKRMIPVGFSIPTECEVSFNPSRRNNYDKIPSM
jgi:hypothetical protein